MKYTDFCWVKIFCFEVLWLTSKIWIQENTFFLCNSCWCRTWNASWISQLHDTCIFYIVFHEETNLNICFPVSLFRFILIISVLPLTKKCVIFAQEQLIFWQASSIVSTFWLISFKVRKELLSCPTETTSLWSSGKEYSLSNDTGTWDKRTGPSGHVAWNAIRACMSPFPPCNMLRISSPYYLVRYLWYSISPLYFR